MVDIEEELAQAKNRNQELQAAFAEGLAGKTKTIELLEKDLTKAPRLDEMEGNQGSKSEKVKDLETKLANAKEALEKANENRNQGLQAALSDELADKTKTIELLENDLAEALARSAETSKLDDDSRIKELERELAMTKIELDESQQRNSVLGRTPNQSSP